MLSLSVKRIITKVDYNFWISDWVLITAEAVKVPLPQSKI